MRALVFWLALAMVSTGSAAARPELGIHKAFVADNHLVLDGEGRLHLVYLDWDGVQTDVFHTLSEDEGLSWSLPTNLSQSAAMSSSEPPDLAVDPDGRVVFVWSEGEEDSAAVYVIGVDDVGSVPPTNVAETGNWASGPKIEFDPGGLAHVVWYDEGDPDSRLAYLRGLGEKAEPAYIGPETGYAQHPSLSIDQDGNLHVVFSYTASYGASPIDVFYLTSADGGLSWSDTTRLSETSRPSLYPHLVVDPYLGTVHVVWQEGEDEDAEVRYVSNEGKGWTEPLNLSNTPGAGSLYPTLSIDGLGTLHLVWSDEEDGDFDVHHRSLDWSLVWGDRENVSDTGESSLGTTQLETLSGYGFMVLWVEGDASPFRIEGRAGFSEVLFTDVAGDAGLDSTGISRVAAWADVDGDGDEDLAVLTWPLTGGSRGRIHLNRGATFDLIESFSTDGRVNAAAWGDYDNDGDRDLAVAQVGGRVLLYRNAGDGSLEEVGSSLGLVETLEGQALAWSDYDRDGWVDLYVTSAAVGSNVLYDNGEGSGFSETALAAGVDAAGADCRGAAWADYDRDGWPDLSVAVCGPNLLFHNEGDGTFAEVATVAGVDDPSDGEACSWADFDLDGDLDLFVLNQLGPNALFRNDGGGSFTEVTETASLEAEGRGAVAAWADVDNDGDPDLFTSQAVTALYRNNGKAVFTEVGSAAGLALTTVGEFHGAGWADHDSDGDLDLFLNNSLSGGADYLFLNGDYGEAVHNWLLLDLVGLGHNLDGIGAQVTLWNEGRPWLQEVTGGLGFSQSGGAVHFGLGEKDEADSLVIVWPSGQIDRLVRWRANRRTTVVEGGSLLNVWPGDTDNNGVVNEADVLPLVVYWHREGAERAAEHPSSWEAQTASTWDPDSSTYADADGDGRVEVADLLPIGVNWSRVHPLPPGAKVCQPVIRDHGPYLEIYEKLLRAVEEAPAGRELGALCEYLEGLIALARSGRVKFQDRLIGFTPNPSRSGTEIRFEISRPGRLAITIYDVRGRRVWALVEDRLRAGRSGVYWDGRNDRGTEVAPGVYLCRMVRGRFAEVRKLVVVR